MTVSMSAAARFASIEELLLILAEHIDDRHTLWSLCLANWRFNCVFTAKLSDPIVVQIEKGESDAAITSLIGGLIAGPYLPDLRHLRLIINTGPVVPERELGKLLKYTPNLKVFTWESADGDIPASILVQLSKTSRSLEELHLSSGPEPGGPNHYGTGFRDHTLERPTFERVRVFTCRGLGTWHALYILQGCRSLETVRMTQMGYMLALGWVHSGYHAHLRALVAREEADRRRRDDNSSSGSGSSPPSLPPAQYRSYPQEIQVEIDGILHAARHNTLPDDHNRGNSGGTPKLTMHMCYSRSAKMNSACEVCDSPGMRRYDADDPRYHEVWPWATGRARQFLHNGHVRHITYEYPRPEPAEAPALPLYDEVVEPA